MRRWRILTIGQTDLFLHPAVLPFAAYAFLSGHGMLWLTAVLSVLVHETAHALTAAVLGCPPSSIEMTPLGAVMLLEDETKLPPIKRAAMLLAGPAASLLFCCLAVKLAGNGWTGGAQLFLSNLSIVMVNLLPVFPLDGGRLLYLILSRFLPARTAEQIMRVLGCILGIGLIFLNVAVSLKYGGWNLSLAFAGCSIIYSTTAAMTTNKLHEIRMFMDRKIALERRGYMKCEVLCVMGNLPLRHLLHALPSNRHSLQVIIEPGTMAVLGFVGENQMIQQYLNQPTSTAMDALALSKNRKDNTKIDTI